MENAFLYSMASVLAVSLVSLVGIFALSLKQNFLNNALFFFVSFATGSLLGAAFFDLIPESIELMGAQPALFFVFCGLLSFFAMEKFLFWYHCHKGKCDIHTFTYLNLAGDAVHNFIDGAIIAAAFITDPALGVVTSIAIIAHEVPQEIGDYAILVYGGFEKMKALYYNFLSALFSFAGALAVFGLQTQVQGVLPFLLAFGAGGFLYIASTDLLPELHKQQNPKHSFVQFALLLLGAFLVVAMGWVFPE